jgi:hypothetical protein
MSSLLGNQGINPALPTEAPILGLYAQLIADNPTPLLLQLVTEYDTKRQKVGDGVTAYNDLEYLLMAMKKIEVVSGDYDGVNTTFVFGQVPLKVYQNGEILKEGVGYTLTPATNTIVVSVPPFTDEIIWGEGNINLNI